jgi:hypothetical protein
LAAKLNSEIPDADFPATVKLAYVFDPVILGATKEVLEKVTLLNVWLPPAKVGLVLVATIDEVPALNVKLVDVVNVIGVELVRVTVLLPRLIVLATTAEESRLPALTSLLLVVNVPAETTIELVITKGSPSVTVIPVPLIDMPLNVLPAEVIVPVALKVNVLVLLKVIPATNVMLPDTVIAADPARVPVNPVQVIDLAPVLPVEIVTVLAPEVASKNTSSADVGTAAPVGPPTVEAHLLPAVPSQAAVPPRQ